MRRLFFAVAVLLAVMVGGAYLTGVRVFVVQPIGVLPDGITVVVTGSPGLRFIDSPDAFCQRTQGDVNLLCRGMVAARVAQNGTIILRLPYSSLLYNLTGAPQVDG